MKKDIVIYGHGGSQNHGNEAIVRGVCELFPDRKVELYSIYPEIDKKFGLDEVCEIKSMNYTSKRITFTKIMLHLVHRICRGSWLYYKIYFSPFINSITSEKIYLLEAGDQYCESGGRHRMFYAHLNKLIRKKGAKTIMLGCTVDEKYLNDSRVIEDLNNYSMVIARESVTYEAMKKHGVKENLRLAPCPAFAMKEEKCELPKIFSKGRVVGVNMGFLTQGNEKYFEALLNNYRKLIDYIIRETDYAIALIPHVNWSYEHSDLKTLQMLCTDSDRIYVVPEHNAPQMKYILQNVVFFVGLRTHATVSALGVKTPSIITGYKQKSTGICLDIYGNVEHCLIDITTLYSDEILMDKFRYMLENEKTMKQETEERMNEYMKKLALIKEYVSEVENNTL